MVAHGRAGGVIEIDGHRTIVAVGVSCGTQGGRGTGGPPCRSWYAAATDLERLAELAPGTRTAALSPFDNLLCDRARTAELFGFDHRLEIYVPGPKRVWGYYVLPILHGERFIARADLKVENGHLSVLARLRDRQLGTVVGLVADMVEKGKLKFSPEWVDKDRRNQIHEACDRLGLQWLKPIKEALPPEVSFEEIRLVVADLRRRKSL